MIPTLSSRGDSIPIQTEFKLLPPFRITFERFAFIPTLQILYPASGLLSDPAADPVNSPTCASFFIFSTGAFHLSEFREAKGEGGMSNRYECSRSSYD